MMNEIIYKEESYQIIGACMKVHAELGAGFLEPVYQEALEKQFTTEGVSYEKEKMVNVYYNGEKLNKYYKADFLCFDKIIVELKAAASLHSDMIAQVQNYLRSTNLKLGLLVNFGEKSLVYKRVLNPYFQNSINSPNSRPQNSFNSLNS